MTTNRSSRQRLPSWKIALGLVLACSTAARADGRPGAIEFSDGHKLAGAVSLTPGKDLRVFTDTMQVSLSLDEVTQIRFLPEKEQMWEGFYFPDAGQTTQVKTGEVYPIRYLKTEVTLADGKVITGHLYTTVFYIENDDGAQKVVVTAKQTGTNGEKMADLTYPTLIHFDGGASAASSSTIDLTQSGLTGIQPPVVVAEPDLTPLPVEQVAGKSIWTMPMGDATQILFSVEAADGIHVAWPQEAVPGPDVDPNIQPALATGLKNMQDFYDNRTLLGSFVGGDGTDIYSLVMMKRLGAMVGMGSDTIPWSLVILRWKYDPDQKKATLLNRALLKIGRQASNSPPPVVLKQPELLRDISGSN
jgi:hypothetical protein